MANNIVLSDGAGNIKYQWNGTTNTLFGTTTLTGALSGTSATFSSNTGVIVGANSRAFIRQTVGGDAEMGAATGGLLSIFSNNSSVLSFAVGGAATFSSSVTATYASLSQAGSATTITQNARFSNTTTSTANGSGVGFDFALTDATGAGKQTGQIASVWSDNSANDVADLAFYTRPTGAGISEKLRITGNGNVGINMTSPSAKMQILSTSAGSATVGLFLNNFSTTINTEIRLAFAANTNDDIASNRYSYISALNTSGSNGQALLFATNEAGASAVERMRIASGGTVSIGNSSPQNLFNANVRGLVFGNYSSLSSNSSSGWTSLANNAAQTIGSSETSGWSYQNTDAAAKLSLTNGGFAFQVSGSGTAGTAISWTTAMTIMNAANAGKVGIGTATPSSLLTVAGTTDLAYTNGTTIFRIDRSGSVVRLQNYSSGSAANISLAYDGGNVGIGTTSPVFKLDVRDTSTSNVVVSGFVNTSTASNTTKSTTISLLLTDTAGTAKDVAYLRAFTDGVNVLAGGLAFDTRRTDTTPVEAMRITSGGSLLIGQSASSLTDNGWNLANSGGGHTAFQITNNEAFIFNNRTGGTTYQIDFRTLQVERGNITVSDVAVAYNTVSDYRLKEDLKPIKGLEIVNKINVYDYKWKSENTRMDGVLAHELQEILPYAVQGIKDGEKMQSVDYSKIVPVMVQAIKELTEKVKTLENK